MSNLDLYMESDNKYEITIHDENDLPVNDATATATLWTRETTPVPVTGAVDLPMAYITESAGKYSVTIPDTVTLTENAWYTLVIKVDRLEQDLKAKYVAKATYYGNP